MDFSDQFFDILILATSVVILAAILTILVLWARKGNKGANLVAAMFTFFAPDPQFQKNYKILQESESRVKESENESGDPPAT